MADDPSINQTTANTISPNSPIHNDSKSKIAMYIAAIVIIVSIAALVFLHAGQNGSGSSKSTSAASTNSTSVSNYSAESWANATSYPISIEEESCVTNSGYIYCVGGLPTSIGTNGTNATYYAQISATNGSIGTWQKTANYPQKASNPSCVAYDNYIYCISDVAVRYGSDNDNYYAPLSSTGIGAWQQTTSIPLVDNYSIIGSPSCAIASGYIFCLGLGMKRPTSSLPLFGSYYYVSYYATASSSGIGQWQQSTVPDVNVTGEDCNGASGYVYCFVGIHGNVTVYAGISSSGVTPFSSSSQLPYPSPFFGSNSCAIDAGYIYCTAIGSLSLSLLPLARNVTYFAPVSSQGVGLWKRTENYPLPSVLGGPSCTSYSNYLYCVGGEAGNDALTNKAYFATLKVSDS